MPTAPHVRSRPYACAGDTSIDLRQFEARTRLRAAATTFRSIPLVLRQTATTSCVTSRVAAEVEAILSANPDVRYDFVDDAAADAFMASHFAGSSVLHAYRKLCRGAARSDLWRYCALQVKGGIYLDLDSSLKRGASLRQLLYADAPSYFDDDGNLVQWFLAAAPGSNLLNRTIGLVTERVLGSEPNIFYATGPTAYNDAFALEVGMPDELRFYSLHPNKTAEQQDRERRGARTRFLRAHGARILPRNGDLVQNYLAEPGFYLHSQVRDLPTHYDHVGFGHTPTPRLYCDGGAVGGHGRGGRQGHLSR